MKVNELLEAKIKSYSPPKRSSGYDGRDEWSGGDAMIKADGKDWVFTGKTGTTNKKQSFEYSRRGRNGEERLWVTIDGEIHKE